MREPILYALDMDGTALNSRKEITPRTRRAIRGALAAGDEVVFCTGRSAAEMGEYLTLFPEMRWLISESGAAVLDLETGKEAASFPIEDRLVERAFRLLEGRDVLMAPVMAGRPWLPAWGMARLEEFGMEGYRGLFERSARLVEDPAGFRSLGLPVRKINLYFRAPREREEVWQLLSREPFAMASSVAGNIELSAPGVDKGVGLEALCRRLGIPLARTVAVGDSSNDAGMMRAAGVPVAMGNATPEILALARHTVADCEHDGAAQALEILWPELEERG